jgi:hypothetical protein
MVGTMSTLRRPALSPTDVWVAVLAGEGAWGSGSRPQPAVRLAAQIQATGLLMVLSVMWTLVPERLDTSGRPWIPVIGALVATVGLVAVLVRPLLLALGRRRPLTRPGRAAVFRFTISAALYF